MSSSFTKSLFLVSLSDQRFFSVTSIIQFLNILSSHEKYQTQKSVVDQLSFRRHAIEEELVSFLEYVVSDQIWSSKVTLNQFIVEWQFFQKLAHQIKRKRNKFMKMKRIIKARWKFSSFFLMINRSYHFLNFLRKLIEQYFRNEEVKRIIKIVTHRVMHSTSNRKFIIQIIVNDIILVLNSNLFVLSNEIVLRVAKFFVKKDQFVEVNNSMLHQISIDSLLLSFADNFVSFDDLLETSTFSFKAQNLRSTHDVLEFSLIVVKNSSSELFEMFDSLEKTVRTRKNSTTRHLERCICSTNVLDAWKKNVREKKKLTIEKCLNFLRQTHTFDKLCYYYMRWLISNLDLMTNQLNENRLRQRLHFINVNRLRIDNLKMNVETYNWFQKNHRLARFTNVLRSYRFFHQDWSKFVFDTAAIQIDLSFQQRREWFETNNLMLSKLFDWWFDQKILMSECSKHNIEKIVLKEFEMYKHHLRRINQRENNDWLRNMFYFIDQQLMRQNSLYYRWYVKLRSDKCWKLISYSYYEKYVMKRDSIFFRHIDQNISQLISFERDVNMIQDILSLNDEDINNCIVIFSEMHHHLSFWWKRMISRDLTSNNYVHQIIDQMYIKKNAQNFNSSWTNIICRRENVRITLFLLSHESVELTQFIRRRLLSWFVDVKEDDETLKNIEINIWFELTIVHRDLIAVKRSSSEFFNHHEAISYRFSSTVEITDLDVLSDAILCRLRWFSFLMHADRNIFLSLETKAMKIVRKWRHKVIRTVIHVYQTIKNAKMRAFEEKSFYHFKAMTQESFMLFISDDVDSELEIAEKWFDKLH